MSILHITAHINKILVARTSCLLESMASGEHCGPIWMTIHLSLVIAVHMGTLMNKEV